MNILLDKLKTKDFSGEDKGGELSLLFPCDLKSIARKGLILESLHRVLTHRKPLTEDFHFASFSSHTFTPILFLILLSILRSAWDQPIFFWTGNNIRSGWQKWPALKATDLVTDAMIKIPERGMIRIGTHFKYIFGFHNWPISRNTQVLSVGIACFLFKRVLSDYLKTFTNECRFC